MALDFYLIKFTNYAEDFIQGHLYLNSLEYYRGIEEIIAGHDIDNRNDAVNDCLEGSIASISKSDLETVGINFGKEINNALIGNVHLLSEELKFLKILCLYTFIFDAEKKVAIAPTKKCMNLNVKKR